MLQAPDRSRRKQPATGNRRSSSWTSATWKAQCIPRQFRKLWFSAQHGVSPAANSSNAPRRGVGPTTLKCFRIRYRGHGSTPAVPEGNARK